MFSPVRSFLAAQRERLVPAHLSFVHYLGALALVFFALQVVTGILLMIYYQPSATAHTSTAIIMDEVTLGWLVRSLHYWGSELLIAIAFLHMIRVYFSRAYQHPRHLNWIGGAWLLGVLLALGFTGTLLPWDQYAYWYTDSARRTISGIPVLGNLLLAIFWGGREIGEAVLLRFYVFHVGVLPWVAVLFIYLHFIGVWHFGIKEPAGFQSRPATRPFFPDFLVNLFIAFLLVGGIALSLAVVRPPALLDPANPLSPLPHPLPPWYLASIRGLLRGLPAIPAALVVLVSVVSIFLVPALDRNPANPLWKKVVQRGIGLAVIGSWILLTVQGYQR